MEFMNLKESNEGLKEKAETLGPHRSYAIGPGSIANKGIAIKEFVAPGPDGSKIGTQGMLCSRGCPF